MAMTIAFLLYGFPMFLEMFFGARGIMPMLGLIVGLLSCTAFALLVIRKRKYQLGITFWVIFATLYVVLLIAWFRFNVYATYNFGVQLDSPMNPIDIFSAQRFYTQQEFGAGVALAFAFVCLGVLVSCIPIYRARDIPENLEKEKIRKAQEMRQKQNQFRARVMK
jgi:hypothetical protein